VSDARHHRASYPPQPLIIFVEVPVGGSPAPLRQAKPDKYPRQERAPWKLARSIPVKQRRAQRLIEIMRRLDEREAEARRMLQPNAALLKQWLAKAA
jgi:hypothetical protein